MVNRHVQRYYQPASEGRPEVGSFSRVIAVHEEAESWATLVELCPQLPRGWYELAQLAPKDRPELVKGYWAATLPYVPHIDERLELFFGGLEDIGIYLTQSGYEEPYLPQMVYSLEDNTGFFHGFPPASETDFARLQVDPLFKALPGDYLAFLRVHDGFSKVTDTGLILASALQESYQSFQEFLSSKPPLMLPQGRRIKGEQLIPFYQSFGLQAFQCFHMDWSPEGEMGCVYYSGIDHTLSDYRDSSSWADNLAFPTFLDWLAFYLETVRV